MSYDGTKIISASEDTTIIIWNLLTGKVIKKLTNHANAIYNIFLSTNGKKIVSRSSGFEFKIGATVCGGSNNIFTERA